jgi:1,4-alpha-glucan branching enzyme
VKKLQKGAVINMGRKIAVKTGSVKKKAKKSSIHDKQGNIKKQYYKPKPLCKITFRLPKEAAEGAETVTIVGDFNNWNVTETPMKRLKCGDFTLALELPCNREFNFRYLIDSCRWEEDWFADKYVPDESEDDSSVNAP